MNAFYLMIQTLLGAVCLSLTLLSMAQDDENDAGQLEPAEVEAAAIEAADSEPSPAASQDRFIPTEKINADTEISFPIDI